MQITIASVVIVSTSMERVRALLLMCWCCYFCCFHCHFFPFHFRLWQFMTSKEKLSSIFNIFYFSIYKNCCYCYWWCFIHTDRYVYDVIIMFQAVNWMRTQLIMHTCTMCTITRYPVRSHVLFFYLFIIESFCVLIFKKRKRIFALIIFFLMLFVFFFWFAAVYWIVRASDFKMTI